MTSAQLSLKSMKFSLVNFISELPPSEYFLFFILYHSSCFFNPRLHQKCKKDSELPFLLCLLFYITMKIRFGTSNSRIPVSSSRIRTLSSPFLIKSSLRAINSLRPKSNSNGVKVCFYEKSISMKVNFCEIHFLCYRLMRKPCTMTQLCL